MTTNIAAIEIKHKYYSSNHLYIIYPPDRSTGREARRRHAWMANMVGIMQMAVVADVVIGASAHHRSVTGDSVQARRSILFIYAYYCYPIMKTIALTTKIKKQSPIFLPHNCETH